MNPESCRVEEFFLFFNRRRRIPFETLDAPRGDELLYCAVAVRTGCGFRVEVSASPGRGKSEDCANEGIYVCRRDCNEARW